MIPHSRFQLTLSNVKCCQWKKLKHEYIAYNKWLQIYCFLEIIVNLNINKICLVLPLNFIAFWERSWGDGKPIIAGYPLPHWDPRRRIRTVCANSQKQGNQGTHDKKTVGAQVKTRDAKCYFSYAEQIFWTKFYPAIFTQQF